VERWIELAGLLKERGYEVVLLGGPREDRQNREISKKAGVRYPGLLPLKDFPSLVSRCDMVITQVSMAMHVAIALDKELILMNNIFNRNEFYLYGKGVIIEPELECLGCYKSREDKSCPVESCMDLITVETVYEHIQRCFSVRI